MQPVIEVQIGHQRYTPQQRLLSSEETLRVLEEYQRHHTWGFRELMHLAGYAYDGTPERLRAIGQVLQGVAWHPQYEEGSRKAHSLRNEIATKKPF